MTGADPGSGSTIGGLPNVWTEGRTVKWPWRAKTKAEAKTDQSADAIDGPACDEESIGERIQARMEADAKAAAAAERAGHERMVERWGTRVVDWRDWLARSPSGWTCSTGGSTRPN